MKASRILWFVLGGLVLAALGFAIGFVTRSGGMGFQRGLMVGGAMPFLIGFRMIGHLIQWLGPLAGIAALILVLSRRNTASPAPAPASAPATASAGTEGDATATAVSDSTPPMPLKKKQG